MTLNNSNTPGPSAERPWLVFVGFDDLKARQRASEVCDFMTRQFWPEIEFDLHLCDFSHLGRADYRQQAVAKAAAARIVIVATCAQSNWEQPMFEWMDGLCALRHGKEGALVSLVDPGAAADYRDETDLVLRQLAHRAGLDYLTHAPDCKSLCLPSGSNWAEQRADKVGTVLEEILGKGSGPVESLLQ